MVILQQKEYQLAPSSTCMPLDHQMHVVLFCHLPIEREDNTFCLIGKQHIHMPTSIITRSTIIVWSDEGPKETQSISSSLILAIYSGSCYRLTVLPTSTFFSFIFFFIIKKNHFFKIYLQIINYSTGLIPCFLPLQTYKWFSFSIALSFWTALFSYYQALTFS